MDRIPPFKPFTEVVQNDGTVFRTYVMLDMTCSRYIRLVSVFAPYDGDFLAPRASVAVERNDGADALGTLRWVPVGPEHEAKYLGMFAVLARQLEAEAGPREVPHA